MAPGIRCWIAVWTIGVAAGCAPPPPDRSVPPTLSADRGGDLYRDNCNACHTAQVHWRDKRAVKTWDDLRFQVGRWQRAAGQAWTQDEIDDVAAYLNRVFYDLPCPAPGCRGATTLGMRSPR